MRVAPVLNVVIVFLFSLSFLGFVISLWRRTSSQDDQAKQNEVEPFHILIILSLNTDKAGNVGGMNGK